MQKAIGKLFHLYPHEIGKAALFGLLALFWGTGAYGTLILSEGMLLQHVGSETLPLTYLYVALSLFAISSLLLIALNHINISRIFLLVMTLSFCLQILFYIFIFYFGTSANLWITFKVFGWVIPICTYISFWAFVDQYFDLQAAKRAFALFNAILFLADACGGGLIAFGLRHIGVGGLILAFSTLTLLAIPCALRIIKTIKVSPDEHEDDLTTPHTISFKALFKKVISSKYTLVLILFYFVMQLLAITTEFSYMEQFESTLKSANNPNYLTEFLGRCGMWIALGNMVFGMFIYNRLVRKIGVNNIIVIAPLFFLAIFLFWFNSAALFLAVFAITAREGVVYSLDDNNLNLLLSGVPSKVKNQVRFGIESFFEPAGMLTSSCFLLLYQAHSKLLGILLATIATIIVLFLRALYAKAIFKNLIRSSLNFSKKAADWFLQLSQKERKKIEFTLLYSLKKCEEGQQLLAFEYLLKLNNKKLLSHLLNHIGSLTLPAKCKAIELLGESQWVKEPLVIDRLKWWAKRTGHRTFQCHLHFYFARHDLLDANAVIGHLKSPYLGMRGAAILTLKRHEKSPHYLAQKQLEALLESEKSEDVIMALKILGFEGRSDNIELLLPYLDHSEQIIKQQAATSIAHLCPAKNSKHTATLLFHLKGMRHKETRNSLLKALKGCMTADQIKSLIQIAAYLPINEKEQAEEIILQLRDEASSSLVSLLKEPQNHPPIRLLAAKILSKYDLNLFKRTLTLTLPYDIDRTYHYFYHAHTIQEQLPEHNLELLGEALLASFSTTLNFVIHLLALSAEMQECEILANSLQSKNKKQRACAYETIEKSTDSRFFALLKPLLAENSSISSKLSAYLRRGGIPLHLTQLLDSLEHSSSHSNQIIALTLKARLKAPNWKKSIQTYLDREDHSLKKFATELLEG